MQSTSGRNQPIQPSITNTRTTPIATQRSVRRDEKRVLTSFDPGKIVPLAAIPLLREDEMARSTFRVNFDMAETAEMLVNAVNIDVSAYYVSKLAFDRFQGMDSLNRSYMGEQEIDGSVIPWFNMINPWQQSLPANGVFPFYKALGIHPAPDQTLVNGDYLEAYAAITGHIYDEISPSLTKDTLSLAAWLSYAPWRHTDMKYVKPTFDQAMISGEVSLDVTSGVKMPLRSDSGFGGDNLSALDHEGTNLLLEAAGGAEIRYKVDPGTLAGQLFTEMESEGITVSLANIDRARETRAFAMMRSQMQGLPDEYLIDLLMRGIRLPEQALKKPVLLDRKQRYATDADNLDKSATRGYATVDLNLGVPQTNTGGVVMIVAQANPQQLYERQRDYYFTAETVDDLPDYLRDILDEEPVDVIPNSSVDTAHTDPDGVFGYAPLNWGWMRSGPNLGGKFYRPDPQAAFNENRQRIWATEAVDPVLGDNFYLAKGITKDVFADSTQEVFEVNLSGIAIIRGNTVFGPALRESTDDYQTIIDQTEADKIVLPDPAETETEETSDES